MGTRAAEGCRVPAGIQPALLPFDSAAGNMKASSAVGSLEYKRRLWHHLLSCSTQRPPVLREMKPRSSRLVAPRELVLVSCRRRRSSC